MVYFKLEINLDSDDVKSEMGLGDTLKDLGQRIQDGTKNPYSFTVKDRNGNTIGHGHIED